MLKANEVKRLERILEAVKMEIAGKDSYSISFNDIQWLALQLQLAHASMVRLMEGKSNDNSAKLIINQAKEILILKYKMSEPDAHKFLRQTAMTNRTTKFQVAKKLIDAETS